MVQMFTPESSKDVHYYDSVTKFICDTFVPGQISAHYETTDAFAYQGDHHMTALVNAVGKNKTHLPAKIACYSDADAQETRSALAKLGLSLKTFTTLYGAHNGMSDAALVIVDLRGKDNSPEQIIWDVREMAPQKPHFAFICDKRQRFTLNVQFARVSARYDTDTGALAVTCKVPLAEQKGKVAMLCGG